MEQERENYCKVHMTCIIVDLRDCRFLFFVSRFMSFVTEDKLIKSEEDVFYSPLVNKNTTVDIISIILSKLSSFVVSQRRIQNPVKYVRWSIKFSENH